MISRLYGLNLSWGALLKVPFRWHEDDAPMSWQSTVMKAKEGGETALAPALLTILADPFDHHPLVWEAASGVLSNRVSGRVWPVLGGIPALVGEAAAARYNGISTWYDQAMQDVGTRGELGAAGFALLAELIGPGSGVAVDIGCGTGLSASTARRLGYAPLGVDLSFDMLSHALSRLPVIQGNAAQLPLASNSVPLAYSTFTTTDWDDLSGALAEIHRVLKPGGRYVSIAVHPCFYGGYAEPLADGGVRLSPGYHVSSYHPPAVHKSAVRSRVGAWHRPLVEVFNSILGANLRIECIAEGGPKALPEILAISAIKPHH